MRQCLLPYFNKDQFSGDLRLGKSSFEDMAELKESVSKMLEGDLPFRINTDESDSEYEDSINDLIQTLYDKIDKLDLKFEFDAPAKRELNKYVKSLVMPRPLTKTEKLIQANIAGSDLITEDQRRNIRFGKLIRSLYGKEASPLNASRQNEFDNEIIKRTIIDVNRKKLVTDTKELNDSMGSFQSEQYEIIKDYLIRCGYNLQDYDIPQNLYHTDNATKLQVLTKGYYNLLTLMYNEIQKVRKEGNLEQLLEDGWSKFIFNNKDATLYRAVNAYINLAYFDNVLDQSLGEYIQINKDYDSPITMVTDSYGLPSYIYRYTFAKGNKFAVKTWGSEQRDSLKEMSKFSQILIKSIPIYEYNIENEAESESFGRMEVKDFVNTISKLLDLSSSILNKEIQDALCSFQNNPRQSILFILQKLFSKGNKEILNNLFKLGFDQNYINYLYSIYRVCFKGTSSWDSIEQKYIRNNGLPQTYPIIDTILGVMNSNVSNNFLETTFNYDEQKVQTQVKKKYNDRSTKFDIINNVNSLTINRQNKSEILNMYKIGSSGRNYKITISVQGNPVQFEFMPIDNTGILDKKLKSTKLNISNMPNIKEINLGNINDRRRLVGGVGLSDNESRFMSVLKFIDTMLSTNFSSSQEGLRKIYLMQNIYSGNFKELFASAARALVVTDIYDKFETSIKGDGTRYSKSELLKFLEDKKPYYDAIQSFNDRQKKQYFIQRYDGYQLSTVYSNQIWLDNLSQVEAILSGETSKSVISDLQGNKVPNFSPQYYGARIEQQLKISSEKGDATSNLLFVKNRNAIKHKVINTDILTKDGIRKQIKSMTTGELLYDSIVNKFFTPILSENVVYTQPTTYSDKTKFLLYGISLDDLHINSLVGESFNEQVERLMKDTIGKTYKGIWYNVKNDYKKLFPEYIVNGEIDVDSVQDWFNTHSAIELQDKINEYNTKNNTNLVFYKDTHFREIELNGKKHLSINELLIEYTFDLYEDKLHSRLEKEKLNFLNDLLSNRVSFPIQRDPKDPSKLLPKATADSITGFLIHLLGSNAINWVHGSNMILAKATNKDGKTRDVLYGDIKEDETVTLNPVLNAYFMLDNLIGNNLRMSLTGSEINHKVKSLSGLNLDITGTGLYKSLIKTLNPKYSGKQTTFYDIQKALNNYKTLQKYRDIQSQLNNPNIDEEEAKALRYNLERMHLAIPINTEVDPVQLQALRTIYDKQIYKIENAAQNAQFKRNVIIPGTMRPYTPNCINGIGRTMKIAVINDVPAKVFNFDGKSDKIDAHDGSAMESPITSILENKSLQDNEVGTIKKPIHHWYDDRFGTATLLKYAVDTITNQWMRQAEGNDLNQTGHAIQLRKVFKKMHNVRWSKSQNEIVKQRGIDLIDGCDFRERENSKNFHSINFHNDILQQKDLFYKKGGQDIQIVDFGVENGVYYTIEQEVDSGGRRDGMVDNKVKVYHYFNDAGDHFPSSTILNDAKLHTIDSLYELHTAMGGIYSESINSDGFLQYSEASNIAVANFVNSVAYKKNPNQSDKAVVDQSNYYQPLKEMLIDMVANNSAVKNGAGNVNQYSAYYDDSNLSYMEIGTSQYGIQMDADHTADEGKMTEFSQVISSLDAGGRLHGYVAQIYDALGQVATQLSQIELDAVKSFRNGEGKSKMYDIIVRTIVNNLSNSSRGEAGLAESIIENIKKELNLNTDHDLDSVKMPFSDHNIYYSVLPTVVSIINKKSIKRQYPGQGTVMVPGYDLSMIYDLNGRTYQFEDLIKMAVQAGYQSDIADTSQYNKDIVFRMLQDEQNKIPVTYSNEGFQPTDNVLIYYDQQIIDPDTQQLVVTTKAYHASLKEIYDYYLFKDDIISYLASKKITGVSNIRFKKDITIPRNLAPVKISWNYTSINPNTGKEEVHTMNIFDHWRIKGLFQAIDEIESVKGISKAEKKRRIQKAREQFNPQQAFDELDKGYYIDQANTKFSISDLQNKPAELIMSNLYKTTFGLKDGDSLADVLNQESSYFKYSAKLISSTNYDMAFTKQNGKHLYLTFKPIRKSDDTFDSYQQEWPNTIRKAFEYPEGTQDKDKTIINRVYATNTDNLILFEIGREILRNDVLWDSNKKKFTDADGKILKNQSRYRRYGNDKVLEYIEFLSQYNVQEEIDGKLNNYTVYNINRALLASTFNKPQYKKSELTRIDKEGNEYTIDPDQKFNEEVNDFISRKLLAKIYESSDFDGVQLNSTVTPESHTVIKKCLYRFGNALSYDPELSQYLSVDLLDRVNKSNLAKDGFITYEKLNNITNKYRMKIAKKKYVSFLRSQSFTASRIPAQTLQSFMQMHCVGFTGVSTNQCFVSHWQTWLQGSDYDIDKAYIMGLSFDSNGRYVGWSNLFNYSSKSALKASEDLPMPRKIKYTVSQDGVNIDSFISQIEQVQQIPEQRIKLYADLLNYLYKNKITNIFYTLPYGKTVVENLETHEFTDIPVNLMEDASKNFVSSHIQNVIQNLRNMIGAYSPIEMEDFRGASEGSPKGEQSAKMTLLNPATKLLMQIQNITGKNVIGIAANGEKASFMWHYYINDILRQLDPLTNIQRLQDKINSEIQSINSSRNIKYDFIDVTSYLGNQKYREQTMDSYKDILNEIPTLKTLDYCVSKLNYAKFEFNSTRICGRAKGDPIPQTINTLPDVNFENVDPEVIKLINPKRLTGYITVDLMISQVLSAATDNAKELILAKVNAGNKLAKVYLFLITLGFNIDDIVKFMTSPAINFIDAITESNIFTGYDISIKDAIKVAKGDYSSLLAGKAGDLLLRTNKTLFNLLKIGNIKDFKNPFDKDTNEYIIVEDLVTLVGSIKHLQDYDLTDQGILQDIQEFQNVMEGADEFSQLGQLLGANQGIPTSKVDIQKKISNFQKAYSTRFSETRTNMEEPLDTQRFFIDPEYAKMIKDNYNKVKKCVNIFDVISHISQFKSIFDIFSAVNDIDHNLMIKTQIYDYAYNRLSQSFYNISEQYQKNLLESIDNVLISMFINTLDIEIPYAKGITILQENRQSYKSAEDGLLRLTSYGDIATFKSLFENQIIPDLKRGIITDIKNGNIIKVNNKNLIDNPFIKSLITGFDKDTPLYKCDLNMLTISNSNDSKIKFYRYLKGLKELKSYTINNIPLSDLFVLYNLVVNKDRYGSDRLTTLFDSFLQSSEELSMIKQYLGYIGDLDYYGEVSGNGDTIKISYEGKETVVLLSDLKKMAAPIVKSLSGQKDPTVIVNEENGPRLYEKSIKKYQEVNGLIPEVKGESLDQRLERVYNDKAYFVLGGGYKILVDRLVQNLQQIDSSTINTIKDLQRRGILTIQKVCE